jgi:hypothetical protein
MIIQFRLLFILFFLSCSMATAQDKTVKKDSTKVYKKIENYSKKNKFRKFVYKLLFKSARTSKPSSKSLKNKYAIVKDFEKSECKIIRNINIVTLDPFGYSVSNELDKPNNGFERFGNSIHLKSKVWTIRNQLLIKKNQPLDSLLAKESERLVRRQRFVRSVIIKPIEIPNNKDSVDISVLDSWSLIPNGAITNSQGNLEITERNFLGLGHEFENNFINRFDDKARAYNGRYTISNFKNTFINSSLYYENDINDNTRKSAKIERAFYSPLTRFAGGIYFENRFYKDSLSNNLNQFETQRFKLETQVFWFGHAVKLFPGKTEDFRTTNFVTTLRYQKINYTEKPNLAFDPSRFFNSEQNYLASIGITTRKFAEEKYLFNFGIIEDVPYGQVYSITGGFQNKNNTKRAYFGGRFAYGSYYNFGYIGTNIEWGSFLNHGISQESTFRIEANYFTPIIHWGNWKIRQFNKSSIVFGNNRDQSSKDRLNINESNGINGFNSPLLYGNKKWVTTFQTQTYSPGNWHGFHFNPYLNFSFAMLGDEKDNMFNKQLYSSFGIGVLINNDYLVFNSFQISFSFYPNIPNEGFNIFKTNTLKNNDLSIPDYQIGQPTIVPFN